MIRILAVDPHAVVRTGLRAILGTEPGMDVVGEASGADAVRLADELDSDVIVVEVALPGMTGADLIARLCAVRPDRKVLALTACEDQAALCSFVAAGAVGYVLKRSPADELVRAIRVVAGGAIYLDPAVAARAMDEYVNPALEAVGQELSEREREVVRLIALGYSNKEIAARMKVSAKTVETYKTRSMIKLKMRGRVDIVRYAVGRGWLTEPATEQPVNVAAGS